MVRKTLAESKANPPASLHDQRARLEAMTDDEIDGHAATDAENPEWSDERLDRAVFARDVRRARQRTGLTQTLFAKRYHIAVSRLRDWEQARYEVDSVAAAYIKAIRHDPKAIERALEIED